jgi:hypothetical protein
MSPQIAECMGLWRRTLLVDADGSRDVTTNVLWLQGYSLFVDLRGPSQGFAGRLGQHGDVFEWTRLIDLQLPGLPDAGRMSWQDDTLIEVGVHADYIEHWRRDSSPGRPCFGLLLSGPAAACGVLVRVGERFGWARREHDGGDDILLGIIDGSGWWITDSAHQARVGTVLRPQVIPGHLRVDDITWTIEEQEGRVEF